MAEENNEAAVSGGQQEGQFGIQKVYVKDLSFETPNSPEVFQEEWKPTVNLDISNSAKPVGDNMYEVTLSVTVTVKSEEKPVYLVEGQQAGIFQISGFDNDIVGRMLATLCPNILFPFAREMIADLVTRGGFPQLLLSPVNFDALYQQHQEKLAAEAAEKNEDETKH